MRVFGLTGGIASGKSTVHTMLTALGAHVLDADAIYHRLIAPADGVASPLTLRIGERFPGVVRSDGSYGQYVGGADAKTALLTMEAAA